MKNMIISETISKSRSTNICLNKKNDESLSIGEEFIQNRSSPMKNKL